MFPDNKNANTAGERVKDENKDDIVEDTLLNYNKQIARLVKAIASDKRITILGYLMKGSSSC